MTMMEVELRIPEPDPREGKLPGWAQVLLARTRLAARNLNDYARAARLETNPDETNTILDQYSPEPVGLPNNADVTFRMPDDPRWQWITASVRSNPGEPVEVEIRGSAPFTIEAPVSNRLRIRLGDR